MTALAEEVERRMQMLDPERAARFEKAVRSLLLLLDGTPTPAAASPSRFVTQVKDLGLRPGIDPTKLGQLAEDL